MASAQGRPTLRFDPTQLPSHSGRLGEQQRLAFARLLLHRPRWIFMEEATDEASQDAMTQLVLDELPDAALVSIGQRPGLAAFHTRTPTLVRAECGARLSRPRRRPKLAKPAPAR